MGKTFSIRKTLLSDTSSQSNNKTGIKMYLPYGMNFSITKNKISVIYSDSKNHIGAFQHITPSSTKNSLTDSTIGSFRSKPAKKDAIFQNMNGRNSAFVFLVIKILKFPLELLCKKPDKKKNRNMWKEYICFSIKKLHPW